ncbi:MAG: oligopeptide transporter ATP-binding protein [Fibrobacteres bacterium]|nr:oligopeptide transporter ATP-binding protein [Fibrobacterota bacterium]
MKADGTVGGGALLSIRDLCIWFGGGGNYLKAVNHASLEVGRGEIVGLIGQSGSGKTTLAMGLLGLVKGYPGLWSGEALLDGKSLLPDMARLITRKEIAAGKGDQGRSGETVEKKYIPFQRAHRRQLRGVLGREIATIFQEPKASLDPFYTVGEHMLEALERNLDRHGDAVKAGGGKKALKAIGVGLLKDVGLVDAENLWGLHPHEISGGMAQRVMISMALCAKPKLLIADEPSTSLDVTTQAKLLQLFLTLRDKHGLSIIIISHDIGVIQEISSRIYVMHRGAVVETGASSTVLGSPKHPYTASLLDSFSRFGEKLPMPPSNPDGGKGCAYRDMCAAYRGSLTAEERAACEDRKPIGQADALRAADLDRAALPAGRQRDAAVPGAVKAAINWSKCHYPGLSKAHGPGTPSTYNLDKLSAEAGGEENIVEVRGLRKRFSQGTRSFLALNDISLSIPKGKTYGLVGESGSGKSTLGLSIMALQGVDGGEILYKGEDILKQNRSRMLVLRKEIRMLFQHPEGVLNSGMTIDSILAEGLEREGRVAKSEIVRRVAEALEQVRLDPSHGARYPSNLSSGEKQRATIARALITKPAFLVCDEPVASLDLAIQSQVMSLLKEFQRHLGLSYLFISHNLALVKILADRIGVMYMGYLVEEARVEHFTVHGVRHPYTRLLLASTPSLDPGIREILSAYPDVEPVRLEGGCPFRNRCPIYLSKGSKVCESTMPPLLEQSPGARVACHYPLN